MIPAEIRRKFGITEGTRIRIDVDEKENQIILKPLTREGIANLRGKYRGKKLLKSLMADRRWERNR